MIASVIPKEEGRRGEDRIVVTPTCAAIIDGATTKDAYKVVSTASITSGEAIAEAVSVAVKTMPENVNGRSAIDHITATVRREGDASRPSSASVLLYLPSRREVVVVGAGAVRVDDQLVEYTATHERVASEARALYLIERLQAGASLDDLREDDLGRRLVFPILQNEALLRNVDAPDPFYFGAIDGQHVPDRYIGVYPVKADARQLSLASDGYPKLLGSFESSERYLAKLIETDPLMIRAHKATKGVPPGGRSFDDRSYLQVRLG
jgi:glycerophosphoryl diester phosphodiesterase